MPGGDSAGVGHRLHDRPDSGQTTAEYALVLVGAAAVALLLGSWALKTNLVARLLNAVPESIIDKV